MEPLVVLNLGQGNCQQGLPNITAQLWLNYTTGSIKCIGALPPQPTLPDLYQRWQQLYQALQHRPQWQDIANSSLRALQFDLTTPTHISTADFETLCQQLQSTLNQWLNSPSFQPIDRQLRTKLSPADPVRIIIETDDPLLQVLPWHLWTFCTDYPTTEVAISPQEYDYATLPPSHSKQEIISPVSPVSPAPSVRVLAILGHSNGIDVQQDITLLQQLPGADITMLSEPSRPDLDRWLWDPQGWDILFFAGHSTSQAFNHQGHLFINPTESVSIGHLHNALKAAIACRLKLAIFNSCDGTALGRDLADLNIPQLIVMREPIPDQVAQMFLKNFLQVFASGVPLYPSVRQAREQLQGLESMFPCASWLPVIYQNPAEAPFQWPQSQPEQDFQQHSPQWRRQFPQDSRIAPHSVNQQGFSRQGFSRQGFSGQGFSWQRLLITSLLMTTLVMGLRLTGMLETWELQAYDQFVRWRPPQPLDERLLLVTINETDIDQQSPDERRGTSLTDAKLEDLLTTLEAYRPRVIALDIFRDFATDPNYPHLINSLATNDRLVTTCSFGKTAAGKGIAPPPELPSSNREQRVGYSSSVVDSNDTIRRALLMQTPRTESMCPAGLSLGFLSALRYFKDDDIYLSWTNDQRPRLRINQVVFKPLENHTGGYHTIDDYGHQIMINFRPPTQVGDDYQAFQQISLLELLNTPLDPQLIEDRIVVIGNTDASFKDFHRTPYSSHHLEKISGVEIHAHIISHILSTILNDQPLLWAWSQWLDGLWILGWTLMGGSLMGQFRPWPGRMLIMGGIAILLSIACYSILLSGGWVPWVPALITLMGTVILMELQQRSISGN